MTEQDMDLPAGPDCTDLTAPKRADASWRTLAQSDPAAAAASLHGSFAFGLQLGDGKVFLAVDRLVVRF